MPSGWGNRLTNNPSKIVCLGALKKEINTDWWGRTWEGASVPGTQRGAFDKRWNPDSVLKW